MRREIERARLEMRARARERDSHTPHTVDDGTVHRALTLYVLPQLRRDGSSSRSGKVATQKGASGAASAASL